MSIASPLPADEVEDGREVGDRPEPLVEVAALRRRAAGLAEQLDGRGRVVAPATTDAERRQGVRLEVARLRPDGLGDPDGLLAAPLRLAEHPVEHLDLGQRGEDEGPLAGRFAGHEVDRAQVRRQRARRIAGRPPVPTEPLVQEPEAGPVAALVEPGGGGLGVGGRPERASRRRRRPRPPGPGARRATCRRRPRSGDGRPGAGGGGRVGRIGQLERALEQVERVAGGIGRLQLARAPRVRRGGPGRRRERGASTGRPRPGGRERAVATEARWRRCWSGRRSAATARPISSWRKADRLRARRPPRPTTTQPCSSASSRPAAGPPRDRGRRAGACSTTAAAAVPCRPRRPRPTAASSALVSGPSATARSRRTRRHSGVRRRTRARTRLLEPAGLQRTALFAAGDEHLLDRERVPARPLRDEEQQRRGRPLAVDRLDELRQLPPVEQLQLDPTGRPRRVRHRRQIGVERVGPGHLVGLVRGDDGEAARPRDPRDERDERPRRGIDSMEVLHDEEDRPPLPEGPEHPEEPLQHPRLPALRDEMAGGRSKVETESHEARLEDREQPPSSALAGPRTAARLSSSEGGEDRAETGDDRRIRRGPLGGRRDAADDGERLRQGREAPVGLVEEPRRPCATGPARRAGSSNGPPRPVRERPRGGRAPVLAPRTARS